MSKPSNYGYQLAPDDPALPSPGLLQATQSTRWLLQRDDESGALGIIDRQFPKQRPLRCEFGSADIARRVRAGRQQPLAKACGLHMPGEPLILDLTAGLCRDAWVLASLGARLKAYERHPLLFALANDALRLAGTPVSQRILLNYGDGHSADFNAAQVLFLDPMFPTKGKRAAPGLEMQILQQLIGADADTQSLLDTALSSGVTRVVLKRPPRGARVRLGRPDISFGGGRVVYDVYLKPTKV